MAKPTVGTKTSPTSRWGVRNIQSISGLEVEYEVPDKDVNNVALRASKMVCADCNNGWMSDLEGRIKDVLLPMVRGEPLRLAPSMVANLGTWAAMKSILVEYADRQDHVVEGVWEDTPRDFGRDHEPPSNTLVVAAMIQPVEMAFALFTGRIKGQSDHVTQAQRLLAPVGCLPDNNR